MSALTMILKKLMTILKQLLRLNCVPYLRCLFSGTIDILNQVIWGTLEGLLWAF